MKNKLRFFGLAFYLHCSSFDAGILDTMNQSVLKEVIHFVIANFGDLLSLSQW